MSSREQRNTDRYILRRRDVHRVSKTVLTKTDILRRQLARYTLFVEKDCSYCVPGIGLNRSTERYIQRSSWPYHSPGRRHHQIGKSSLRRCLRREPERDKQKQELNQPANNGREKKRT